MVGFGLATPGNLLLSTFLIGAAGALTVPAWQSVVPLLVPRDDLPAGITANSVGVNISRAIGPALGGVTISALGIHRSRVLAAAHMPLDPGPQRTRGNRTAVAREFTTAANENHRRDGLNLIAGGEAWLGVGIDFGQSQPRLKLPCCALECRRHGAARPAPGRPKIHEHRQIGSAGVTIEMRGIEIDRMSGK